MRVPARGEGRITASEHERGLLRAGRLALAWNPGPDPHASGWLWGDCTVPPMEGSLKGALPWFIGLVGHCSVALEDSWAAVLRPKEFGGH